MKTKKKLFVLFALYVTLLFFCSVFCLITTNRNHTANAQTETEKFADETTEGEQIEPRGWFTNMKLGIKGEGGYITATVKNDFTMFNSVIWTYVELYSSENYQESYSNMQLMAMDSIRDLDMGKSISVSVSTNGETRYWQARMRYKFDNNDWVSKTTSTFHYDGSGNEIV